MKLVTPYKPNHKHDYSDLTEPEIVVLAGTEVQRQSLALMSAFCIRSMLLYCPV